ncbi:MAG: hypothetical protein HN793_07800 [Rhodospirillaceae bacterium]|jgi:hypothetical protein|nr:hypothetical protein [Rhodospirillaceae bacterium]MBT5240589.1 hypothetical protein [Rhodospirillaceae bacterium]MBT5564423.1 hypothetical protein [Rhodospirillaceae bacterium]MBT6089714.1 hypothetical protein [Rhodospirillaceae bacterium]MBT6961211.1 hypothetical protein [Rhodospirillaceae bacterium]
MKLLIATTLLTLLAIPASAQTEIERDFDTFVTWFSGNWDNEIQTFNESIQGLPDDMRHGRIHMKYQAVTSNTLPGVLFVIENYGTEGLQGDLNYVSVHHFYADVERQAIAHELWFSTNGDWNYLAGNADAAADLSAGDYRFNQQCVLYWKREASQFKGATDPGACITTEGGEDVVVEATGILSRGDLWRSDLVHDTSGKRIRGLDEFERFRKARFYSCYGRHKAADGGWVNFKDVRVHNQGDFVWLGGDTLGIQMRRIIWTSGFFGNALALQAYQNGSEKPTVNGHAALNASFIGLDHPEFVVNCKRPGRAR